MCHRKLLWRCSTSKMIEVSQILRHAACMWPVWVCVVPLHDAVRIGVLGCVGEDSTCECERATVTTTRTWAVESAVSSYVARCDEMHACIATIECQCSVFSI